MIFIRPIVVLTCLTLKQTLHTRAAVWLLIAMLAAAGGVPFIMKSDGTAEGIVRMLITYPPFLMFSALLTGTIWIAAGLMAREIESGEMTSVITTPVSPAVIWLGKWFGIMVLNAVLLLIAAAVYLISVTIIAKGADHPEQGDLETTQPSIGSSLPAQRLMNGNLRFQPDDSEWRELATAQLAASHMMQEPAGSSFAQVLNALKTEAFRIPPGTSYTWTIPVTGDRQQRHTQATDAWSLRFRFHCDARERVPLSGHWSISAPDCETVSVPTGLLLDGLHLMNFFLPGGLPAGPVKVTFSNSTDSVCTAFFNPLEPVELLQAKSTFPVHLGRTVIVLFCFLAAAASLALFLSTLFSFPVAVFTTLALLFAVTLSQIFAAIPTPEQNHDASLFNGAFANAGEFLLLQIHGATSSAIKRLPLSALANGYCISNREILNAFLILFAALPALFCLLSTLLCSRKEYPQ